MEAAIHLHHFLRWSSSGVIFLRTTVRQVMQMPVSVLEHPSRGQASVSIKTKYFYFPDLSAKSIALSELLIIPNADTL